MSHFVTCICGKKLESPSEYADHCKKFPDHFRHTPKDEPEVEDARALSLREGEKG